MIENTSDILDAASQHSQRELDSILAAHKARKRHPHAAERFLSLL